MATRRALLQTGAAGLFSFIAGCAGINQSEPTETDQPVSTGGADFEFRYEPNRESLLIRYTGGGSLPASNIRIRTSSGSTVRWHKLGTTSSSASQRLPQGATAVIGESVLNWGTAIKPGDTIYVVYTGEQGAAETINRFAVPTGTAPSTPTNTSTSSETSTSTPTSTQSPEPSSEPSQNGFVEGFEDGDYDGWQAIETPEHSNDIDGNDWSVVKETSISGEYSLRINSHGDNDDNTLATNKYVVDMSEDFDIEFTWQTPDSESRGVHLGLLSEDGTNFEDRERGSVRPDNGIYFSTGTGKIGNASKGGGFCGTEWDHRSFQTATPYSVHISKRNDTATLYVEGEEQVTGSVRTNGEYRLTISTSGTWGDRSTMYFDTISVQYQ